ncbi:lipopolysaccharide biosynthesis protein [Rheinheimera sp.]|uniref:lipopolysaccharide biosynthesis protein n=1 Tax=Rheinheimera sp. TaxID=1869214 RepID=UPI002FDE7998
MTSALNRARDAFKWTLYLRGMSQITTWLISLIVIRYLSPVDYGIVALTEIIFMLMMLFCSAGLGDVVIQRTEADEQFNRKVLSLLLLLTGVMCVMLLVLAPYFAAYYKQPELTLVLRFSALVFMFSPWLVLSSSILARNMDFKSRGKIDLFAAVTTAFLSLALAYLGFGFWSLIIASLLNTLLRTVGYNLILRKLYLPAFDLAGMWSPFKFGITVAATSLLFGLFMKIDILVIGNQIDSQTLGYYALAMHLALLPMVKIMPLVNEVAYPMYANIKHNPSECQRIFSYILRMISFAMFPLFFGFSAVAPELVYLLLGTSWLPAVAALQIILLTVPFRIVSNLFSPLLKALGHPQTGLQHVTFSCLVVGTIFYIVAPYGLTALALAWVAATPLILAFALTLSTRKANIPFGLLAGCVLRPAMLAGLTLATVHSLAYLLPEHLHHLVLLLLKSVAGALIYLLLSWLLNRPQLLEASKFRL